MTIAKLTPQSNWILFVVAEDGRTGTFEVGPYLKYEAFEELRLPSEFMKVCNRGYFIEWACGAELSADTIEAHWQMIDKADSIALKSFQEADFFVSG